MASRQAVDEESAEAKARVAVDNLSYINKERRQQEQQINEQNAPQFPQHQEQQQENTSTGYMGSMLKSVGDAFGRVKEAVTSKTPETESKDCTNYMGENVDSALMQKMGEYKDSAVDKAGEDKDYAGEEAREEKDIVSERMAELRESAADAARRARDFRTGEKHEMERRAIESGDLPEEKYKETEDKAKQKMQELKLKGVYDEAKQKAAADSETAADRGIAAKSTIYGAMPMRKMNLRDAIREKLTYPTDIVQEARATQEYGGPKRGENLVDDSVKGGPTGPAASPTMKASD